MSLRQDSEVGLGRLSLLLVALLLLSLSWVVVVPCLELIVV